MYTMYVICNVCENQINRIVNLIKKKYNPFQSESINLNVFKTSRPPLANSNKNIHL